MEREEELEGKIDALERKLEDYHRWLENVLDETRAPQFSQRKERLETEASIAATMGMMFVFYISDHFHWWHGVIANIIISIVVLIIYFKAHRWAKKAYKFEEKHLFRSRLPRWTEVR